MTSDKPNTMRQWIADPNPLGFLAMACISLTAAAYTAGWLVKHDTASLFPAALWIGGYVEILVGILQFLRGDRLSATAFSFLGAFWACLGFYSNPLTGVDHMYPDFHERHKGWGVFEIFVALTCLIFALGFSRTSWIHVATFLLAFLSFLFHGIGHVSADSVTPLRIGGWFSFLTGLGAMWIALNGHLKHLYDIPLFPMQAHRAEVA